MAKALSASCKLTGGILYRPRGSIFACTGGRHAPAHKLLASVRQKHQALLLGGEAFAHKPCQINGSNPYWNSDAKKVKAKYNFGRQ